MKILLRQWKRKTDRSLYLDYYENGKRRNEYLGLYLTGNAKQDKATLELAEKIRSKRIHEHAQWEHGFFSSTKQKADFPAYCRAIGASMKAPNTRLVWHNAIQRLEKFADGPLTFGQVTEKFMQDFRDYLLKNLKQNSASVCFARIQTALKRAGITKRVSFHTARHSFATMGLTHGIDIYTMSKLLGHRDLSSTQIYAKIVDEKKRKAVDMLPKLKG